MNLEDEIQLYQFGQGISTYEELFAPFGRLEEPQKRHRFMEVYWLVKPLPTLDTDIDQALRESPLDATYTPCITQKPLQLNRINISLPTNDLDRDYTFLLYLFKIMYQRQFAQKKDDATAWQYQDLGDPQRVQSLLTDYHTLVDQVYNHASYRSEFLSLTKLWYNHIHFRDHQPPGPPPKKENTFSFLSYDELISVSLTMFDHKNTGAIRILYESLGKALSKSYKLDGKQAQRLIFDIINRHFNEQYDADLNDIFRL